MRELLTGNESIARGLELCRVEVVPAYPITPQTSIVEEVARICSQGKLKTRFVRVESEHSSMACAAAASMTGARVFTATSSQGLAYMHEMLHWVSGSRLPMVMVNINRALGAPWNLWSDHSDSLSQRDTGWMQIYCATNQECHDTIVQAFRLAETVLLPVMIVMDGFILSHTVAPVEILPQEKVDLFLPPYQAKYFLNPEDPRVFNILAGPEDFMKMKHRAQRDMIGALRKLEEIDRNFKRHFDRNHPILEEYKTENAEIVLIGMGAVCETAKDVVDDLRKKGIKAGMIRIRLFRPFPREPLQKALGSIKKVAVLDQAVSLGAGGTLSQEIKQTLFDAWSINRQEVPLIFSYISGLGGVDITPKILENIFKELIAAEIPQGEDRWMEEVLK